MSGTQALLSEYTQGGSEQAFRELVNSYVSFVFSTALRLVSGDRPLAEDVTQTVFTDLARKAAFLPKDVRLGGWLHRHTCFVARKTLRRERRRIAREKLAIELQSVEDYSEANLAQLALVLDEAINDLSEQDRNAIVLRFFEELDYRSIGEALDSTEDAARMRVSRAVEKMGGLLKRRGVVLTAAGISFVLSGKLATAAPVGLATRIVYVELARPVKVGIFAILKEACFTRLNVGIVSATMILGLLLLLFSGRHTTAKVLPDPDGKTFTPAEFADLAVEESDEPPAPETQVAATKAAPSAVSVAPVRTVAPPVQTVTVTPTVINAPRAQPPAAAATSPAITPVPADNSGVGGSEVAGNGRLLPDGVPGGRPRAIGSRTLPPPKILIPAPTILSNSPGLFRGPPKVLPAPHILPQPNTPSTPVRAMAAATEPQITLPSSAANSAFVQSRQPVQPQRGTPSTRSTDPRNRGQQP
jgi:RNA polymerase sigma factor (sigma-70 family)